MAKLEFNSIKIRKAPGFPDGLKAEGFDTLSPSINIITGPNGAGKSTIARVVQKLIWHEKSPGLNISGRFKIDASPWTSEVDSDYHKFQTEGIEGKPEGIIAAESQNNYMLALHELINVGDESLAERIMVESMGGFDLDAAQKELNYSDSITRKKNADNTTKLSEKTEKLVEAEKAHKSVKGEEEQLSDLKLKLEKASQARNQGEFYGLACSYLEARKELEFRQSEIDKFTPSLKNAIGNELKAINDLNDQIKEEENNIADSKIVVSENKDQIKVLSLPERDISNEEFTELENRISALLKLEQDIANNEINQASLKQEEKKARESIENLGDPDLWKGIDLKDIGDLDRFYQDALRVSGQTASIEDEIDRLREGTKEVHGDSVSLQNGISILSDWLKEQSAGEKLSFLFTGIALVAGLAAIAATFIAGKPLLWAAALMAVLIIAHFITRSKISQRLRIRQSDFSDKGYKLPDKWVSADVTARVSALMEEYNILLSATSMNNFISNRLNDLEERLRRLKPEKEKTEASLKDFHERIKAVPGMADIKGENYTALYWFIKHVTDWQKADMALDSLRSIHKELERQRDEHLLQCNIKFVELGAERATDWASCRGIADRLKNDESSRSVAKGNIRTHNQSIAKCQERINGYRIRRIACYQSLGLADGDFEGLRDLMEQLPFFNEANDLYRKADTLNSEKLANLKSHSLYRELEAEIAELATDQALEKQEKYRLIASGELDLARQISETNFKVRQKLSGNELEELIAERQNSLNLLGCLYEKDLSSVTGSLLVAKLRKITAGENQQEIFKRANSIFGTITNQKYRIRVNYNPTPSFIAYDNVSGTGLFLSELSTGTRVQLLLSVRLAFIETQEGGVRLPVMADELLANSDDERAAAIIEALYAISKSGRQLFYMTAQPDEVGKWLDFLKEKDDHDFRIINLNSGQPDNEDDHFHRPGFDRLEFIRELATPGNMTIREYRKILNIPKYDLMTHRPEKIPVGYLSGDPLLLYNILKSGIEYWGQLTAFVESGGTIDGLSNRDFEKIKDKIKILEEFRRLYKIGRPRTIGWEVIADSGLITPPFRDRVKEKLDEVNGNPVELISSLENIQRFKDSMKNDLKTLFIEQGYMDEDAPFEMDEIRVRLLAKMSYLNLDSSEMQDFINGILEGLR